MTIVDRNYGNRLQNYALQEFIMKMGMDVETIYPITQNQFNYFKMIIKSVCLKLKLDKKRPFWKWDDFDFKYIKKDYYEVLEKNKNVKKYDKVVVGSDQVWNPILYYFDPYKVFLKFVPKQKRIAYAASMGIDEVPNQWKKEFSESISEFKMISMREKSGAEAVGELINKKIPVVLDPTMLLLKEEWSILAKKSRIRKKRPYALKYYLGKHNVEFDMAITNYAKKYGLELVELGHDTPFIGPKEFVWLIEHCAIMFTDSFHGSVFSILFHKKFWVFERPSQKDTGLMNSRIETLLTTFKLENRKICNLEDARNKNMSDEIDYFLVERILKVRRNFAQNILRKAINEK